jgi:hypothetical protein
VEDGVGVVVLFLSTWIARSAGSTSNFIFAALGFLLHFLHHWQCTGSGADHELATFPRGLFLDGQRRMAEGGAELFGWFLFALPYVAAIDHDVVFVGDAIDTNRAKGKLFEALCTSGDYGSTAWCVGCFRAFRAEPYGLSRLGGCF